MGLKSRNTLKTYFETGDKPTENQFVDLIDSLKHQEDTLTEREVIVLANRLAAIENSYIQYNLYGIGDLKFKLEITQENAEAQVFELEDTMGQQKKQYFLGDAPHKVKTINFPNEELGTNEYFRLSYQLSPNFTISKFFGNNLPPIPEGYEFGEVEGKQFYITITKQNFGRQIKVVNTTVKFLNETGVPIEYKASSSNWSVKYRSEDTVTDHYDIWDYLYFYYKADLTEVENNIHCKIYNDDTNQLIGTGYLRAGQNNQNVWGGGLVRGIRNIRIECIKQ